MSNTNEKVWGLYNTIDNPEALEELEEIDIWKKINNLGGAIFWTQHDAGKPWAPVVSMDQLIEAQYNLEYLVYSTRRFGVEFSREPSATEHVERSESYNAWFRFWNDHFESMSPEVYDQFVDDKCAGKDISKYMPTGSWKDSLEEQTQKRLK
ncbi:MAG: hypothetical protein K6C11_00750 [Bacilli bacterium]|nr:hypothetical protein [Bacilli bacterium]